MIGSAAGARNWLIGHLIPARLLSGFGHFKVKRTGNVLKAINPLSETPDSCHSTRRSVNDRNISLLIKNSIIDH
ncbi:hypothetical protein Mapa_017561 [Marchantia paleacea]|nr:hypothetical protein Mapa_017561 [Marchantia paleacea]